MRRGFHQRRSGRLQRFQCLTCSRTFTKQTFSVTYFLKRPELLLPVAAGLVAGSAHRQLARSLRCAPSTVTRLSARLGRCAMLFHCDALARLTERLTEPICHDDFETFEGTQDAPFAIATAVGARSWFVYGLSPSVHRRAGRVSPSQRRRLESRPERRYENDALRAAMRTLDLLLPLVPTGQRLVLRADDKPAYGRAVHAHPENHRIHLETFANPERGPKGAPRSAAARARDAALFPGDNLHMLMRHSTAHHRRETIAITRRLNAGMERAAVLQVWRNFVKSRRERRPRAGTPAMMLGLATRPLRWRDVLRRRLFFGHYRLPEPWPELYRREWTTPLLRSNTVHALRYAF